MVSSRPRSGAVSAPQALSFDAVIREHLDYVWRVARTMAGPSLADDIAQEVFLVVRRRLPDFAGGSIRSWLYGITRNVARNQVRGRARRQRRLAAVPVPSPPSSHDRWLEVQQAADLMDRFLERLRPAQREAFVLMEIEELTAAEIAQAVGVPVQTIYSRVRTARAALQLFREELEQRGSAR